MVHDLSKKGLKQNAQVRLGEIRAETALGFSERRIRKSRCAINEGCLAQSVEGDSGRTGVDCGRGREGLFRVGGSRKTSYAGGPKRVADGRVLSLIKAMLKAGSYGQGRLFPSERGTPQGGVVSPLPSNILLTPFDREMRRRGYRLPRYADDGVITCKSVAEARAAVAAALRILKQLGVVLHPLKTRIVHVQHGFEFLGYKIKLGKALRLPASKIRSQARSGALYAYPREKSICRFKDQVRQRTKRRVPLRTRELIAELNPVLRGWDEYYKRAHVRKLFHQLDGWVRRRTWSHRFKRWRNGGWKQLPNAKLHGEYGLVNLVELIPSMASARKQSS
jgi:hypothetical protein